jgi:hypothetical protein
MVPSPAFPKVVSGLSMVEVCARADEKTPAAIKAERAMEGILFITFSVIS